MTVIDTYFENLDGYYPGSKRKRREPLPESTARTEEAWDSSPIRKVRGGQEVEFFMPGALARALGKSSVTIRLWERRGHIPAAPYRLPGYVDARGREHPGKRVYTRRLVEIAIEEFTKRDLLGVKRVEWKKHLDLTVALVERWSTETQ